MLRAAAVVVSAMLIGAACSSGSVGDSAPAVPAPADTGERPSGDVDSSASSGAGPASGADSPLAGLIEELPPAPVGAPEIADAGPRPVGLTIPVLGVDDATIIAVGVEDNGDMEIPPADEVGWYRFGPSPGGAGSAVLAAHIAYDGSDGVFVELDDLELGTTIVVNYDDGTAAEFVSVDKQQYDKAELPRDSIFDRTGDPRLVLITCGGDFNRGLRSYDDNVVVYATAADSA